MASKKSRKDKKGRSLRKGESYLPGKQLYAFVYTDNEGKRRYIYSKSLISLRDKERQILKDELDGIESFEANSTDLNEMFELYLESKMNLRDSTKTGYLDTYNRYVRNSLGKKKIANIKYTDILKFYTSLMKDKGLHISTVKTIQRVIRPTFDLAVRDNIIRNNPASGAIGLLGRIDSRSSGSRQALTIEQQRAFLNYISLNGNYAKWYPLMVFMFGTGCRIGEIIGLRWCDVDLNNKVIDINHSVIYGPRDANNPHEDWFINDPKTESGNRKIPMVDGVYEALVAEKERQDLFDDHSVGTIGYLEDFVFFNRHKEPHLPENVNRFIQRVVDSYNAMETRRAQKEDREPEFLPRFSCHYIRHTFCARLCEADMNVKAIQSVMGHRDVQTTLDVYASVSEKKKKESLDKVFNELELF